MEKNTKIIIGIVLVIIISLGLIFFVVGSVLILSSIPPDPEIISGHDPLYDLPAIMGPLSLYTTNVELEQGAWTQIATIVFNDQSDAAEYTLTTRTKDTGSGLWEVGELGSTHSCLDSQGHQVRHDGV